MKTLITILAIFTTVNTFSAGPTEVRDSSSLITVLNNNCDISNANEIHVKAPYKPATGCSAPGSQWVKPELIVEFEAIDSSGNTFTDKIKQKFNHCAGYCCKPGTTGAHNYPLVIPVTTAIGIQFKKCLRSKIKLK